MYFDAMEHAYKAIEGALVIVILRLGDISEADEEEFLLEAARLKNFDEWYRVERDVRLCRQLRRAYHEADSVKLIGKIAVDDWEGLLEQMRDVLTSENEVALFLSNAFVDISDMARGALRSDGAATPVRERIERFRDALEGERQRLIRQELQLYDIICGEVGGRS
jgi:hypothetical protein